VNEPNLFVFKVSFNGCNAFDPPNDVFSLKGCTVVVEVEPEGMARFMGIHHSADVDRCLAEEIAEQTALQTIQKDLPEGFVPGCDIVQLRRLPDEVQHRRPTLHAGRAYAWLVEMPQMKK